MRDKIRDEDKKRNILSVKMDDAEIKRLVDYSWQNRIRTATLIRQLVNEGLDRRLN